MYKVTNTDPVGRHVSDGSDLRYIGVEIVRWFKHENLQFIKDCVLSQTKLLSYFETREQTLLPLAICSRFKLEYVSTTLLLALKEWTPIQLFKIRVCILR